MFRVDDFQLVFPVSMRMFGYGILLIQSSDRDVPNLAVLGIKNVEKIYDPVTDNIHDYHELLESEAVKAVVKEGETK